LPPNWTAGMSTTHNRVFYFNTLTNAYSWVRPNNSRLAG
jgi:hypothetical protein